MMPRRATTSEPPDNVTVKTERIKVKQEKLKNKGKQRARIEEEPEQEDPDIERDAEDEDAHAGQAEGESSPRGNKRLRVNGEGVSRPISSGSQQQPKMKTLPRDTDGYTHFFFLGSFFNKLTIFF